MRFTVLSPSEVRIVQALGLAMYPEDGPLPSATEARVVEYVDRYLTMLPKQERRLVRLMFVAFGAMSYPRSRAGRTAFIARLENHPLYYGRVLFQALRSVFTLAYYADAEVQRQMGIDCGMAILRQQADVRSRSQRVVVEPMLIDAPAVMAAPEAPAPKKPRRTDRPRKSTKAQAHSS